jgi:hypothetical protein
MVTQWQNIMGFLVPVIAFLATTEPVCHALNFEHECRLIQELEPQCNFTYRLMMAAFDAVALSSLLLQTDIR